MIKLKITKTNNEWLEATWKDNEIQTHCESFSGHTEHIKILRDRCTTFGTTLSAEDEAIVKEIQEAYMMPSQEEIEAEAIQHLVNEANAYLKQTDWVDAYHIKHLMGIDVLSDDSSKLEIINKRDAYKAFLKGSN